MIDKLGRTKYLLSPLLSKGQKKIAREFSGVESTKTERAAIEAVQEAVANCIKPMLDKPPCPSVNELHMPHVKGVIQKTNEQMLKYINSSELEEVDKKLLQEIIAEQPGFLRKSNQYSDAEGEKLFTQDESLGMLLEFGQIIKKNPEKVFGLLDDPKVQEYIRRFADKPLGLKYYLGEFPDALEKLSSSPREYFKIKDTRIFNLVNEGWTTEDARISELAHKGWTTEEVKKLLGLEASLAVQKESGGPLATAFVYANGKNLLDSLSTSSKKLSELSQNVEEYKIAINSKK